jgi:hypothetical protein
MPHFYFHVEDGETVLDDTGVELRDVAAAQDEALYVSGEAIKDGLFASTALWNGTPWRMWVTDEPNGEGNTFFTLLLSAQTTTPHCVIS